MKAAFKDKVFRKLLRGGAVTLGIKIASGVLAFAMAVAMARALTAQEYGKFAALLSVGLFLGQFSTVGRPMLVQRFLGKYASDATTGVAAGLLRHAQTVVFVAALAAAATVYAVIWGWQALGGAGDLAHWLVLGPLIVGLAMAEYLSFVLRSFGRLPAALVPRDIIWRGSVLALACVLIVLDRDMTAASVIGIVGVWLCVLIGLQFRLANRLARERFTDTPDQSDKPVWWAASWGLWGLNVLAASFGHITVVAVGFLVGYVEAGSFFAAVRIVGLLVMPLVAINLTAGPDIARQYHENGPAAVQRICRSSVMILLPVVLTCAVIVTVLSGPLLSLFGETAVQAQTALYVLTGGYLINALSGSTGVLMQMTGHERRFLAYAATANAVALVMLFVLVPPLGLVGAAICVVIATSSWNLAVAVWARRNLYIDPSVAVLVLGPPTVPPKGDL